MRWLGLLLLQELDSIATELASEISREQEHLMLMQDQVDKQKIMLQKDLTDLAKKLDQERTQRTLAITAQNDTIRGLQNSLTEREADISCLEERILALEVNSCSPLQAARRAFASCCGLFGNPRAAQLHRRLASSADSGLDVGGEELLEPLAYQ